MRCTVSCGGQVVVGSDPGGLLVAALDQEGYFTYGMTDGTKSTTWHVDGALADVANPNELPGVPTFALAEARDKVQASRFRAPTFDAVSPRPANVVVCVDVAQHVQWPSGAKPADDDGSPTWPPRRFVRALVAGAPRLVVFAAATPGARLAVFKNLHTPAHSTRTRTAPPLTPVPRTGRASSALSQHASLMMTTLLACTCTRCVRLQSCAVYGLLVRNHSCDCTCACSVIRALA